MPDLDKSEAFGASSRYHFFLELSQLKPWNLKQENRGHLAKKEGGKTMFLAIEDIKTKL